jgi:inner membrane transporter RhtA
MTTRVPAQAYFVVSAVCHYLGPACAVLLFARVEPLGVAWLRITSAAAVFTAWHLWRRRGRSKWVRPSRATIGLGLTLAGMNCVFYLAIDRLPLATVGAIEFLGPIALAAIGLRGRRNLGALALAVAGVVLLTKVGLTGEPVGYALAFANCALFVAYVVLGKRISGAHGIDNLGLSMVVAAVVVGPIGLSQAAPAFHDPVLLAQGVGVGILSSVIPYVCDQLALRRLSRAAFALLLSLLPATATAIGLIVLGQRPTAIDLVGIALVVVAVGVHKEADVGKAVGVREERRSDEVGTDGPGGVEDLPGNDELRRPDIAGLAPR